MSPQPPSRTTFTFGPFEVDLEAEELKKQGVRLRLPRQSFQILAMLVQRPGQLVPREELQESLWPSDTFVDFEKGINAAVNRLREALGDSADNPRYVETLPRRGYRFIAPVQKRDGVGERLQLPAAPALEAISDAASAGPLPGGEAKTTAPSRRQRLLPYLALAVVVAFCAGTGIWYYRGARRAPATSQWVQLTNFPDPVVNPALSPDGRMLAFLRAGSSFEGKGDIFVKILPQGEPVQLTHDGKAKNSLGFSPDGSRISYTVPPSWDTWIVPVLGGEPRLQLPNASGLTWIDDQHILFSELKSGIHMAIVTATESRAGERDVYLPAHETGMAHNSYLSPDRKWVLAVEMGPSKGYSWMPCRLVPFDASSAGHAVGPDAPCVSAGWSVDGQWMFFSSDAGGGAFHIWRQKFPDGKPEQLTSGPTFEDGIAVSPDGQSLVTSVGVSSRTVLLHDRLGERQVALEGLATFPHWQVASRTIFSPDAGKLYFLGKEAQARPWELWVADVTTGRAEPVLPGIGIAEGYDVSPDGKQIVFDSPDEQVGAHIWLASLDHRVPPRRFESDVLENDPLFGAEGDLYFEAKEGDNIYLCARSIDGNNRRRVLHTPITHLATVSPDGQWAVVEAPLEGEERTRGVMAYNLRDGSTKRVCNNLCFLRWTSDAKFLFISPYSPEKSTSSVERRTFVIPLRRRQSFPQLPSAGIKSDSDLAHLPSVQVIDGLARPGPSSSIYAFERSNTHRNLYRIPLP